MELEWYSIDLKKKIYLKTPKFRSLQYDSFILKGAKNSITFPVSKSLYSWEMGYLVFFCSVLRQSWCTYSILFRICCGKDRAALQTKWNWSLTSRSWRMGQFRKLFSTCCQEGRIWTPRNVFVNDYQSLKKWCTSSCWNRFSL